MQTWSYQRSQRVKSWVWGLLSLVISHILKGNPKDVLEPGLGWCHPTCGWACAAAGMGMQNEWLQEENSMREHKLLVRVGLEPFSPRLLGCSCLSASACIAEMSQGYKYTIKCAVPSSATDPAGTTEPIPILWNSLAFQTRMDSSNVLLGNALWTPH